MASIAMTVAACGGSQRSSEHDPVHASGAGSGTAEVAAGTPHPALGPFAGYVWNGDVDRAHADWTVPRILPGSPRGEAATWIGAEAPGPTRGAPFVQVGVNEGNTDGTTFAYGFYSTTNLHFHPVHLFDVSPGDQISATLSRRGPNWQIAFVDRTSGHERQLSVAEGARRRFNEAQYTQEDVTDARTSRPFPYPRLSALRLTGVTVNGIAPRPAKLTTSWLTEADGYLAPAPIHDDGFALTQTQMTAAGWRYLRAVAVQDHASATAVDQLLRWSQGGPTRPATVEAHRFAGLLRTTVNAVRVQRWPTAGRPAIAALRTDARGLLALLTTIRPAPPAERIAWAERFYRLTEIVGADGQEVRRALRLPSPLVPRTG